MRTSWNGVATGLAALVLVVAQPVGAQLTPGVHGVRANDLFAGADGLGVRLGLGSPMPVKMVVSGDWFLPRCDGRCGYQAASLDVHLPLAPVPLLAPYAVGGYTWRRLQLPDGLEPITERGIGLGLGLRLGVPDFGLYVETRYEFMGHERQWVSRLGVEF
jgi:hypothetical protein